MVRLLQGDYYNIIILYHHMYMYIHVAVIITIIICHTHTHTSAITGTLEVGSSGSTIITVLGCMERFLCQGEGTDINWRFFGTRIDVTNTSSRQITVSSLSLSPPLPPTTPHHTTPHTHTPCLIYHLPGFFPYSISIYFPWEGSLLHPGFLTLMWAKPL